MPTAAAATELTPEYISLVTQLAWVALAMIACLTLVFGIVGGIAFKRAERGAAKTFSLLFERAQALKMSAVILIVLSSVVLGLLHIIDSNGLVGILSGIAGYVLGGLERSTPRSKPKKTPGTPQSPDDDDE